MKTTPKNRPHFGPKWRRTSSGMSLPVQSISSPSQTTGNRLMVPILPQKPWEYTGVDFVGPLPRTVSGNAYLLVFVDYFSKWIEVCAVREATAQVAAGKFVSEVFARHGTPTYLISDRGSPFVSELFEHVISTLGSVHRLTTAYHPQTNATECVNRMLKTAICAYVGDKHTSWDKFLSQICFALRTAPHSLSCSEFAAFPHLGFTFLQQAHCSHDCRAKQP